MQDELDFQSRTLPADMQLRCRVKGGGNQTQNNKASYAALEGEKDWNYPAEHAGDWCNKLQSKGDFIVSDGLVHYWRPYWQEACPKTLRAAG